MLGDLTKTDNRGIMVFWLVLSACTLILRAKKEGSYVFL